MPTFLANALTPKKRPPPQNKARAPPRIESDEATHRYHPPPGIPTDLDDAMQARTFSYSQRSTRPSIVRLLAESFKTKATFYERPVAATEGSYECHDAVDASGFFLPRSERGKGGANCQVAQPKRAIRGADPLRPRASDRARRG